MGGLCIIVFFLFVGAGIFAECSDGYDSYLFASRQRGEEGEPGTGQEWTPQLVLRMAPTGGASMNPLDDYLDDPIMYQLRYAELHPLLGWTYARAFGPKA